MKEKGKDFEALLEGIKPVRTVDASIHLLDGVKRKMHVREESSSISPWSYAAAVLIILMNGFSIYFTSIESSTEEEVIEITEEYNWDSHDYYDD